MGVGERALGRPILLLPFAGPLRVIEFAATRELPDDLIEVLLEPFDLVGLE